MESVMENVVKTPINNGIVEHGLLDSPSFHMAVNGGGSFFDLPLRPSAYPGAYSGYRSEPQFVSVAHPAVGSAAPIYSNRPLPLADPPGRIRPLDGNAGGQVEPLQQSHALAFQQQYGFAQLAAAASTSTAAGLPYQPELYSKGYYAAISAMQSRQQQEQAAFFRQQQQQARFQLEQSLAGLSLDERVQAVGALQQVAATIPSSATLFMPRASADASSQEVYSRKVFVGGLPPDIDEDEIRASFSKFGELTVDWPHKTESKSYFPPKGYAFLIFKQEASVQRLISACVQDSGKYYMSVSSPTVQDKSVQIRPWRLSDADYVLDATLPLDPRKTVFVGGVPRPLKAAELAVILNGQYGGVCYVGIDTDPELRYPKGAGRVAFSSQQSYIEAISTRFVQLKQGDIDKRVEIKPYVLDDQACDECGGARCGGKYAPFFCANVACLQYYCETCWTLFHTRQQGGREFHKPLVKESADKRFRA